MPSIAILIAQEFTTALFIPTGWTPNETLTQTVTSTQRFLLPTLIIYIGGKMVYDVRGGVVGTTAAIGILARTEDPMFIGTMIAGPLGSWLIKEMDGLFMGRIPADLEILVNNFLAGIPGALLAAFGYPAIRPLRVGIKDVLVICVDFLVRRGLLPLTSLLVEPARIPSFSNTIDHSAFIPLGMNQVAEAGKSIFFLIEANSDPGLGLLLAYSSFGEGVARGSAPSAVIIHFLGGIYEIYFLYVLMDPLTVLAVMADGMSGVFINSTFNSGLASAASPGSIVAVLGMYAKDNCIGVILGVTVVAVVSFVIATLILKFSNKNTDDNVPEETSVAVSSMKGEAEGAKPTGIVSKIVFACDTEMGGSAMEAATLTKKFNTVGVEITVEHFALDDVPKDTQVIVTHKSLVRQAETRCSDALTSPITNFMGGEGYDEIAA